MNPESVGRSAPRRTVPTLIPFFGPAPDYLGIALRSAAAFGNHAVLIGDESNRGFWQHHWDSSASPMPKFDAFNRAFVKMSDYPDFYEMANWRRPFATEAWMRSEGIDEVVILDGDTVTFSDYAEDVVPTIAGDCVAAVMTLHDQGGFDWASSLHFSWWTLDALADFTSFCIEGYRDPEIRGRLEAKYRWHLEHRQPGGVCEMTLLHFWRERNEKLVFNAAKVWDGKVADAAITTPGNYYKDEYAMRRGFKKLVFRRGLPYGFNKVLGQWVRFVNVQCQGTSKALMAPLSSAHLRHFYADLYHLRSGLGRTRLRASLRAAVGLLRARRRRPGR